MVSGEETGCEKLCGGLEELTRSLRALHRKADELLEQLRATYRGVNELLDRAGYRNGYSGYELLGLDDEEDF